MKGVGVGVVTDSRLTLARTGMEPRRRHGWRLDNKTDKRLTLSCFAQILFKICRRQNQKIKVLVSPRKTKD